MTRADVDRSRDALMKLLRQAGLSREPTTLDADLAFVDVQLLLSPEGTLFSTDSPGGPLVPAGAEVMHIALSRHLRECLAEALAGLVEDGVWDESRALEVGRSVLEGNARRLYGFP